MGFSFDAKRVKQKIKIKSLPTDKRNRKEKNFLCFSFLYVTNFFFWVRAMLRCAVLCAERNVRFGPEQTRTVMK